MEQQYDASTGTHVVWGSDTMQIARAVLAAEGAHAVVVSCHKSDPGTPNAHGSSKYSAVDTEQRCVDMQHNLPLSLNVHVVPSLDSCRKQTSNRSEIAAYCMKLLAKDRKAQWMRLQISEHAALVLHETCSSIARLATLPQSELPISVQEVQRIKALLHFE